MKSVLITGVAGFIGSNIAKKFISNGYRVVGVDDLSTGLNQNIPKDIEFVHCDLSFENCINIIPQKCEIILHLAGQSSGEISFDDPETDLKRNTMSTLNMIRYGINNKSERIIYAGSMSVYGDVFDRPVSETTPCLPLSCYGVSKYASERYLHVYRERLPYASLRMFNVYGPGQDMRNLRQGMVSIFLAQALINHKVHVKGSLNRFRDFIYIDDVVETWYRAATYPIMRSSIMNVGTGVKTTVKDLLEVISSEIPGLIYYEEGVTPGDQQGIYANNSLLKNNLKLKSFVQLSDGVKKFVQWAKSQKFNY